MRDIEELRGGSEEESEGEGARGSQRKPSRINAKNLSPAPQVEGYVATPYPVGPASLGRGTREQGGGRPRP